MKKNNILITCACGCGMKRWKYDERGRERKYINGHSWNGKKIPKETIIKRTKTRKKEGWWKNPDQAKRRIGLGNKGKKLTEKTKQKMRLMKLGNKNPMWKGDNVGYGKLHEWIRRYKPKSEFCEICKKNVPYDLANISGKYKRDVSDYKWICRSCHMKEDGRLKKLQQNHKRWLKSRKKRKENDRKTN